MTQVNFVNMPFHFSFGELELMYLNTFFELMYLNTF